MKKKSKVRDLGCCVVTAIGLILGSIVLVGVLSPADGGSAPPYRAPSPSQLRSMRGQDNIKRGDEVTLRGSHGTAYAFNNEESIKAWHRLRTAQDTDGMQLMLGTDAVDEVDNGTRCRIIEPVRVNWESFYWVRVLEGPHYGVERLIEERDIREP